MVHKRFSFNLNAFHIPYALCNGGTTQLLKREKRGANFVDIKNILIGSLQKEFSQGKNIFSSVNKCEQK